MPLDFPSSPTNGQYYNGFVYNAANEVWDSAYAPRAATIPISSPNVIINGAFDIWQRGTSFTAGNYTADRWKLDSDKTGTVTQQAFTPGTAPVASIEGKYFARVAYAATGSYGNFYQKIEDVRTFAGQTVTLSFWAKLVSGTATTGQIRLEQNFGTGGSSTVTATGTTATLTSSWQRFTQTFTLASIVGKTVSATDSFLNVVFPTAYPDATAQSYDIWGVQLEAGAAATEFRRNAPSIQGELAACQRYYFRVTAGNGGVGVPLYAYGAAVNATLADFSFSLPVTLRANASSIETSNVGVYALLNGSASGGSFILSYTAANAPQIRYQHGSSFFSTNSMCSIVNTTASPGYVAFNAEL